jgi:hypothetical protein
MTVRHFVSWTLILEGVRSIIFRRVPRTTCAALLTDGDAGHAVPGCDLT